MRKLTAYKGMLPSVFNKMKADSFTRGIPFSVSLKYIGDLYEKQKGLCALTGKEMSLKISLRDFNATASLDRKDSSKGYIKNNVQWVLKDINRLKSDFDSKTFIELCKDVARQNI